MNQLLPNTPDGFPEMKSQENEYWGEKEPCIRDSQAIVESDVDPAYWHLLESYCDPLMKRRYI